MSQIVKPYQLKWSLWSLLDSWLLLGVEDMAQHSKTQPHTTIVSIIFLVVLSFLFSIVLGQLRLLHQVRAKLYLLIPKGMNCTVEILPLLTKARHMPQD